MNGFRAVKTLESAKNHEGIAEIEAGSMDEGRVFLHAADGWRFFDDYDVNGRTSKSVGSLAEVREALRVLRKVV